MKHEELDDYPETYSDSIYGEPNRVRPDEPKPSALWSIVVVAWILAFVISALSGCSQVSEGYDNYRATHSAVVAIEFRDGMGWLGFGIRKVGRAAEIEVLEGEKPFAVNPQK